MTKAQITQEKEEYRIKYEEQVIENNRLTQHLEDYNLNGVWVNREELTLLEYKAKRCEEALSGNEVLLQIIQNLTSK